MANEPSPAVDEEQPMEIEQNPDPLANGIKPIVLFSRFLHTGSLSNVIDSKLSNFSIASIDRTLRCVIVMAQQNPILPIGAIKRAYEKKMYLSVEFVLAALAYCAKQNHQVKLKTEAYSTAISMIDNQADFLLFVKMCRTISMQINMHQGFGHGMRRLIKSWYSKYSPLDLANMFCEHRGMRNLLHSTVLKKAHFRKNARLQEAGAAAVPSVSEPQIIQATSANQTATDDQIVEPSILPDDRQCVLEFIFQSGQKYLKFLEEQPALGPGAARMKSLQSLKTDENLIEQNGFTIDQIPAHLLEKNVVWEKMLPSLSLSQLVKYFHTIRDFGFLNQEYELSDIYIRECTKKFDELKNDVSNVNPVQLFVMKRLYENDQRYFSATKATYYEKKIKTRNLTKNEHILSLLKSLINKSIELAPKISANFFITIDLRSGNGKKHVLRDKYITCYEASILLAYSILERSTNPSENVEIYTFTEKIDKLKELKSLLPTHDFEGALKELDNHLIPKCFQSLTQPIAEATSMGRKVDVFIVIVDSVARFCRNGQPPEQQFSEYKAKFRSHAKYIVVNLTRPTPDLTTNNNENMEGFFEICGFNEHVLKAIQALADHRFS